MTFSDVIFCIPGEKIKVIEDQQIYTSQELMNETKYDGTGDFNLHCGEKKGQFIISKNGKVFAFTV